ncbi:rod-binding protein [Thermopetrobacter sp. TC1]|uniref:rod-binding protein n=1 Tax=Thermopetrobacter sp. TC1 TaxID=1495045 RepID=UPI00056DC35E|nr:rod-binding protein [Thermopetrobacter sp. TC1]
MAISPPSDIVMDVIRAADPARAARAAARLGASEALTMRQADAGAWSQALAAAGKAPARPQAGSVPAGIRPSPSAPTIPNAASPSKACGCASAVSQRNGAASAGIPEREGLSRLSSGNAEKGDEARTESLRRAYAGLEALLVRQMLENAFSKGGDALFGGGFAGNAWKALMAQSIADRIAEAGGLGLAATLAASHALPGQAGGARA